MRCQYDQRQFFVHQSGRPVLELSCRISFRMNVGDFLELQGAFQRDGIINVPADVDEIFVLLQLSREVETLRITGQRDNCRSTKISSTDRKSTRLNSSHT